MEALSSRTCPWWSPSRWRGASAPPLLVSAALLAFACGEAAPADRVRASGHVEATDIQLAPEAGGRLLALNVQEGDRVKVSDVIARLDPTDIDLTLRRAKAEHDQAAAQLRLLEAGARPEDVRQAEAQVAGAQAELAATEAEARSAETDLARFEALLESNSGSRKQRDDAATRREVAIERVRGSRERLRGARETLARLRARARREEIEAARARVAVTDAQIAMLEKNVADTTFRSPVAGIVTEKLVEAGEMIQPRTPLVVVTDLDHAWADVFVDEPVVPLIRLGQNATLFTDAGGRGIAGKVTYISSKAEFTPRNVQTAEERSKLVYRVKISVDNREGVLKQGMPVEAEIPLAAK
jgi:HlyD family secretion protein